MLRRSIVVLCIVALATVPACTRDMAAFLGGYYVHADKVFWSGGVDSGRSQDVVGADADTFRSFNNDYARDRSHAYYDGEAITGADASTFEALSDADARDKSHVYRGKEVTGADRSSFEKLGNSGFSRDRDHVWLGDKPISDDPTHFELLDGGMAKDSKAVYCANGTVLSHDPTHFEILRFSSTDTSLNFTKDSQSVYFSCLWPIAGADPATFHLLNNSFFGYAADNQHVFLNTATIPGADPHTFHVLNDNDSCAADSQHAYHRDLVIPNVNPNHFPPGQPVTGCDDTHVTFGR
jgi:hypothetical protein